MEPFWTDGNLEKIEGLHGEELTPEQVYAYPTDFGVIGSVNTISQVKR